MQIFMSATYPLEVIEADRWLKKQPLSGDALDKALKNQDWDPSVKSLCTLPTVVWCKYSAEPQVICLQG